MPTDIDLSEAILLLVALGYTEEAAQLLATQLYANAVIDQTLPPDGDNLIFDLANLGFVNGGNGNDRIFGLEGNDTLLGGNGNDTVAGEGGLLVPQGFNGNDLILGGDGDDLLSGGTFLHVLGTLFSSNPNFDGFSLLPLGFWDVAENSGNDTVFGGAGNDTVAGGDGEDSLSGDAGNDSLTGGSGNDSLMDFSGNNTFDGGGGNDSLQAGLGRDNMSGGSGDDYITNIGGFLGLETLSGGTGNDTLLGGFGADSLAGGNGNDQMNGGLGNDVLVGGQGADSLTGGTGNDTFGFSNNETGTTEATADRILDWQSADTVDLTGSNIAGYVELTAADGATFADTRALANAAMDNDAADIVAVQWGDHVVVWVDFNNSGPSTSDTQSDGAFILQGRTLADVAAADFV